MLFVYGLLKVLLWVSSFVLIVLVLIQRGKGGGLTGALGGMGGQSAFGTKAGDLFTRITVVVASVWILLCVSLFAGYAHTYREEPEEPGIRAPGGGTSGTPDGTPGESP